jgi:hypothetical protein
LAPHPIGDAISVAGPHTGADVPPVLGAVAIGAVTVGAGAGAGASVGRDDGAGSTGAEVGLIGVAVPVG